MNWRKLSDGFKDKSGTICAIGAVVGVFVTAYFSGKAAVRVEHTIDPDMDKKEKAKEYAKAYAKTAVAAGVTSALIIGSDRIHVGKEAMLAGAAVMWKDKFIDLDKKVAEKLGQEEYGKIHREIVDDKIKEKPYRGPLPNKEIGEILVYEPYTDQYIITTRERIAFAMLEANEKLQKSFDVRLNYIIKLLGGKWTPEGDKIGWNWENEAQDYAWSYYGGPWIDMWPNIVKRCDGHEALCIFYSVDPETQEPEDMIYSE